MATPALLERVLWKQLAGALPEAGEFAPESEGARAIRAVLEEVALSPEESACVAEFDAQRELGQRLYDRLLQARVNRALAAGMRCEATRLGHSEAPPCPRVLVVREGGLQDSARLLEGHGGTHVELFASSTARGATAPGARLDELVDLLVLADGAAADALRGTLGPSASIARADDAVQVDLLLAGPTPSIQVLDIERELARLEELLRNAIPPEQRPAKSQAWSFGQDLTGELLGGKYRIKRLKGKGAFKTVYEAEDEMLGARVAVAVLNPKGARSPRAIELFQDEAKKLTTLDHDHIVRWITFDRTPEGLHYFVMEYLDGEELEGVLRREGRMAPARVAEILLQIVAALRRAHAPGKHGSLLHLDLKPENVFLLPPLTPGEPERVKVIDFGIGQHVGAEVRMAEHPELRSIFDIPPDSLGDSIGSLALVEEDAPSIVPGADGDPAPRRVQRARGGTLLYASPEQCRHLAGHREIEPLDGRSDLYSLGVMAFRMLTGQLPFARTATAYEAIQNHLEVPPRRVGTLGVRVPRDLAAFVDRCLVKDRTRRWRDAGEALAALERIVRPRLSPLRVAVPVTSVALLGLVGFLATRPPSMHTLTLIDPDATGVSARGVEELYFGPESPLRTLRIESETPWSDDGMPELRLLDASSGTVLPGWRALLAADSSNTVTLELAGAGQSAVAKLELEEPGRGLARGRRWLSERLVLRHLGSWNLASVGVEGVAAGRTLDPRGLRLVVELDGDPEGRAGLDTLAVSLEGGYEARVAAGTAVIDGSLARYVGPALDGLFAPEPRSVKLLVRALDLAGQERTRFLALDLAAEPPRFEADTGFVASSEPGASLLPVGADTLLMPDSALRVSLSAAARVRIFVEPSSTPRVTLEHLAAGESRLIGLAELGIAGSADFTGHVRLVADDEPFVARAVPSTRELGLPFLFIPSAPELSADLSAAGEQQHLIERAAGTNHTSLAPQARLLVRTPPGADLWLEAECAREGQEAPARRMTRSAGAHALAVDLTEEGAWRVVVRQYWLLAGDVRGPLIPPEHVFELDIDRTAPVLALESVGAREIRDGVALHVGLEGTPVSARFASDDVASATWRLLGPDGGVASGELTPGPTPDLDFLGKLQGSEGDYELTLEVRDRAGNTGSARHSWSLARTGPKLALVEPLGSGDERRWALGSGRSFALRVLAQDPNGVAEVRIGLLRDGRLEREIALHPTGESLWEPAATERPSALPWWTGQELSFELVARDGAGLETRQIERGRVPELLRARALVIAPRDRASAAMVEITTGSDYVFGGREGEGVRPWKVRIPRGALQPYFLDSREVRRGEVAAFLDDPACGDARWWAFGGPPDARRAQELRTLFAGAAESPATEVPLDVAMAFALRHGKRLPTLLEWEFAVRGEFYRLAPEELSPPGDPSDWPANLCSGPREWSATPERLLPGTLDFAGQCERELELLLSPGTVRAADAGAQWVTGNAPGEAASWSARSLRPIKSGHPDVGFRCALDVARAYALLDQGHYEILE